MDNNNRRKFLKDTGMLLGGFMLSGTVLANEAGKGKAFGGIEPYLGEICMFPYGFAPKGWVECSGQLMGVNTNQGLYALLGVVYGGNGSTTFALPNLNGHIPIGYGNTENEEFYGFGQRLGKESEVLLDTNLPVHIHGTQKIDINRQTGTTADSDSPVGTFPMQDTNGYSDTYDELQEPLVLMQDEVYPGGDQAHNNMQPYLVMGFYIAIQGIYPSRS